MLQSLHRISEHTCFTRVKDLLVFICYKVHTKSVNTRIQYLVVFNKTRKHHVNSPVVFVRYKSLHTKPVNTVLKTQWSSYATKFTHRISEHTCRKSNGFRKLQSLHTKPVNTRVKDAMVFVRYSEFTHKTSEHHVKNPVNTMLKTQWSS